MEEVKYAKRNYSLTRLTRKVIFFFARKCPFVKGEVRARLVKIAGVNIVNPKTTFIGYDVLFDDIHPEDITIGENTFITEGVKILTHYVNPEWDDYVHMNRGKVQIGNNVFIGMNAIIVKSITISDGAIIGASSVITKDIPQYTIWAGNPAKQIKDRIITKP